MKKTLLVKYGEIALRGKNRYLFENRLIRTIKKNINDPNYTVTKEQGRIVIENDTNEDGVDYGYILPKIETIFGVVGFCLCVKTSDLELEDLQKLALKYIKDQYGDESHTFKVETKRSDKRYPIQSRTVSAEVGGYVLENTNFKVDVHNPEVVLHVELRNYGYIYAKTVKGFGGLPAGSSGKGMLLLSGGIDSPVAGFLMAKRGVDIKAVYFDSPPFTSVQALEKAQDLAKRLGDFTGAVTLYVVNFTEIQTYLYNKVPEKKLTIFLKRAMLKIANIIGEDCGCHCLITGDSVGQVASQTMMSLLSVNTAATLPIFRPLAGFDKQEIVDIAVKIGTFAISARPYEDCCTIFVAKHPDIHPKPSVIQTMEGHLTELDEMIKQAILKVEIYQY